MRTAWSHCLLSFVAGSCFIALKSIIVASTAQYFHLGLLSAGIRCMSHCIQFGVHKFFSTEFISFLQKIWIYHNHILVIYPRKIKACNFFFLAKKNLCVCLHSVVIDSLEISHYASPKYFPFIPCLPPWPLWTHTHTHQKKDERIKQNKSKKKPKVLFVLCYPYSLEHDHTLKGLSLDQAHLSASPTAPEASFVENHTSASLYHFLRDLLGDFLSRLFLFF